MVVIRGDAGLHEQFEILRAIPGIARALGDSVADRAGGARSDDDGQADRRVRRTRSTRYESGTSVQKPARISKVGNARLRAILYMTALIGDSPRPRSTAAFLRSSCARGKKKMQALVAVMRKLLHGIWIVLQRRMAFDSSILFAASLAKAESSDSAVAANQPEPSQDHPKGRSEAEELRQQLDPGSAQATRSRRRRSKAA